MLEKGKIYTLGELWRMAIAGNAELKQKGFKPGLPMMFLKELRYINDDGTEQPQFKEYFFLVEDKVHRLFIVRRSGWYNVEDDVFVEYKKWQLLNSNKIKAMKK
jgi:hypothetical protein